MTNMDIIRDLFTEHKWKCNLSDDGTVLYAGFRIPCRLNSVQVFFSADPQKKFVRIFGVSPLVVDEENRTAVCKYLTRASHGLPIGTFDIDLDDGEVLFRIGIMVREGTVSKETIEEGLDIILVAFAKYGDGLVSVMMGCADPESAIEKAENQ